MVKPSVNLGFLAALSFGVLGHVSGKGCELCAIYNATNARNEFTPGLVLSVAEQFTSFGTELLDGREIHRNNPDYLDSSITHWVLGYNFAPSWGLNLNIPVSYRSFRRTDLRYSATRPPAVFTEQGSELALDDVSLIGRWTVLTKRAMSYDVAFNLLGGVKFPTGDTDRLREEATQSKIFESLLPPGIPHDPLGHSISSVHPHDLSPGSGSFDGVFGATLNTRWKRWFFTSQFQYSLRTEGEATFQYGDDLLVSGGPGRYLLAGDTGSLSLQLLAVYETMARDQLLGRTSDRTGSTVWYLGPQINFTWGAHFAGNGGVEIPIAIAANGFQSVPDYRFRVGLSWRY